MSRSVRAEKGPGFEYWSRRNVVGATDPGRTSKKITLRVERRRAARDTRKEALEAGPR